jgi:hypothetical protein
MLITKAMLTGQNALALSLSKGARTELGLGLRQAQPERGVGV